MEHCMYVGPTYVNSSTVLSCKHVKAGAFHEHQWRTKCQSTTCQSSFVFTCLRWCATFECKLTVTWFKTSNNNDTFNTRVWCFEIHLQSSHTRLDSLEYLIRNSQITLCKSGTFLVKNMLDIRRAADEAWIVLHLIQFRFLFNTTSEVHSTVTSGEYHNDVISSTATSWSKRFTSAELFRNYVIYNSSRTMLSICYTNNR